jgi:hypothetical protein
MESAETSERLFKKRTIKTLETLFPTAEQRLKRAKRACLKMIEQSAPQCEIFDENGLHSVAGWWRTSFVSLEEKISAARSLKELKVHRRKLHRTIASLEAHFEDMAMRVRDESVRSLLDVKEVQ